MKGIFVCILTLISISLLNYIPQISSERVLFLLPIATKSHKNVFDPLIKGLAAKGHQVDVISPVKPPKNTENIRDINPFSVEEVLKNFPDPIEQRKLGKLRSLSSWNFSFIFDLCHEVYQNKDVIELHKIDYDLIILNGFLNQCMEGLIHKLKAPFVILTTMAAPNIITEMIGNHLPFSFVPNPILDLTDKMTFFERMRNLMSHLVFEIFNVHYRPKYEEVYKKYLGEDLPSVREIESNAAMIMQNSHFSLNYPKPHFPDVIEVGGMHCIPNPNPLPKDIEDFVSGAGSENGFIFFSLGSIVKPSLLPEKYLNIFLKVFSRLNYRIVWKWDSKNLTADQLPPNVLVRDWLPQQDLLGHKNIKLFITHGGLLSTQESVFHGVPCLGIPLFADQDLNMIQAERAGFALSLEILDLENDDYMLNLIETLLNEPKYSGRAKQLSAIFRDEMESPLARAIWWCEYIMRHKGATHLRSAARNLSGLQYYSFDVIAFLMGTILFILILLKMIIVRLFKMLFCKSSKVKKD